MARQYISGIKELEETLKTLSTKGADAVAKAALGGELYVLKRNIKKAAPVGPTGNLAASVHSRFERSRRTGHVTAKAGPNVGKRTQRKRIHGPHAHLVALGTKPRTRKRIGGKFAYLRHANEGQRSTGTMPRNRFVRDAANRSAAEMHAAAVRRAEKALAREAVKAAKRTRSN